MTGCQQEPTRTKERRAWWRHLCERPAIPPPPGGGHQLRLQSPLTTKGNKRVANGTPRTNKHPRPTARPMPSRHCRCIGTEQILAAIAMVERKMDEKMSYLVERVQEGVTGAKW